MLQASVSIAIKEDFEPIDFIPIDVSLIELELSSSGSVDSSLTDI